MTSPEPARDLPREGRIAGVDYGTVRIGLAVSDPSQILASPAENITRGPLDADAEFFRAFVEDESIIGFVVGLPLHVSGDESQKSGEARRFALWLEAQTGLPVVLQDERYTTADAEEHLLAAQLTKKRRKARRDMVAAQLILKAYLDRRGR